MIPTAARWRDRRRIDGRWAVVGLAMAVLAALALRVVESKNFEGVRVQLIEASTVAGS